MKNLSIYTCHHKASAFLNCEIIKPIHVGKSLSLNDICCSGDNTGDNISYKNPFYCELTAHYWVWKNTNLPDYVGFMHYRRHFNFSSDQSFEEDTWGMVNYPEIDSEYENKFGLNVETISECIGEHDLLVPKKWSVKAAGSKNNYHHYKVSDHLHIKDYQDALDILLKKHPEYKDAVEAFNNAHDGYYTNMYVMRKTLFVEYSDWLFGILDELETVLSFKNYSAQEKRVFGHISERLFNIFVVHKIQKENIKLKELQRTFVLKETFNGSISTRFQDKCIPIVICSDDNYAMSLGALLNSILRNSSNEKNYDIVVLDNGLSHRSKERLLSLCAGLSNISLRFFNINSFDELKTVYIRPPFTVATYARLFIPRLFRNYDKVLFIDTDTVVEADLADLFATELGDNLVAAVQDIVMEGFVKFGNIASSDAGEQTSLEYLQTKLMMSRPQEYFQGGIMLFNVNQMNIEQTFPKLMNELQGQSFWFLDQDIMNKVFFGRVTFLPLEWNVYHGNGNTESFYPNLVFSTYSRYLKARQQPKMIHFAGENKPWDTDSVDFYDNFMKNIYGTPWEREIYERLSRNRTTASAAINVVHIELFRTKVKRKLMPYINIVAPRMTKRRAFLVKMYYKIRRVILG